MHANRCMAGAGVDQQVRPEELRVMAGRTSTSARWAVLCPRRFSCQQETPFPVSRDVLRRRAYVVSFYRVFTFASTQVETSSMDVGNDDDVFALPERAFQKRPAPDPRAKADHSVN